VGEEHDGRVAKAALANVAGGSLYSRLSSLLDAGANRLRARLYIIARPLGKLA
jgi:hypothetical protein